MVERLAALLQRLKRDSRGALTFVEIIVILAVIITVIVIGARYFSDNTRGAFEAAGDQVNELGGTITDMDVGTTK